MRLPVPAISLFLPLLTAALPAADVTWAEVHSILDARCLECHGAAKQKAHLRLDTPEGIKQGSKDGAVLVAGKPDESKMYSLAALPEDNDDRMPPKGARLTAAQLTTLKAWITSGASFGGAVPAAAPAATPKPPAASPMVAPMAEPMADGMTDGMTGKPAVPASPAAPKTAQPTTLPAVAVPKAPALADGVTDTLVKQQMTVTTLAGGWLEVNAAHTKNGITTDQLELLAKAAPAIAYLDLANSGITDKQVALLGGCSALRRLHLEGNPLSDAALPAIAKLTTLDYLNLMNTQVSDAGLGQLKSLANLDQLYLWQSKVTPAGAAALQKILPQLSVVLGPDDLPTEKMEAGKGKKKKK